MRPFELEDQSTAFLEFFAGAGVGVGEWKAQYSR